MQNSINSRTNQSFFHRKLQKLPSVKPPRQATGHQTSNTPKSGVFAPTRHLPSRYSPNGRAGAKLRKRPGPLPFGSLPAGVKRKYCFYFTSVPPHSTTVNPFLGMDDSMGSGISTGFSNARYAIKTRMTLSGSGSI